MFNKRLQQLRKSISLTQDELANRLSINRGTYANYERGHRQPDFETLQRIADYFDVTTDYLLGRSETPNLINYKNAGNEKSSSTLEYNGKEIDLNKMTDDQIKLINWVISRESLSFKDKPEDILELIDLIRDIKPVIDELEKRNKK